jgi:S-(hydroxymethyl)mycothiol dehydrogenase
VWATPPSPARSSPAPPRSSPSTSTTGSSSGPGSSAPPTRATPATDPVEYIRSVTDGNGADVCIEAVGNPKVYEQAFFARDLAGTVVLVGVPNPEMKIELPFIEVFGRGGALKSSWYGDCLPSRDFPMLIDLYRQGRLDLDRFVSETIGIDDVEEAFHKMERGEVLRSVVVLD